MKRHIFSTTLLLLLITCVYSQKEVYFYTTKPEDIKVESMHGFEISSGYNPLVIFRPSYITDNTFSVPINMSYFNEKRIAPTWTLTTRIGLTHSFVNQALYVNYKDSFTMHDSVYHFNSQRIDGYKFVYRLNLNLGIEPRWYLGFKNRYEKGKAKLNSGLFLSLPITYSAILINTYQWPGSEDYNNQYIDFGSINISLMLGYRQAISKNWFLEGSLNTIGNYFSFNEYYKKFYLFSSFTFNPTLSLKAAYTFK